MLSLKFQLCGANVSELSVRRTLDRENVHIYIISLTFLLGERFYLQFISSVENNSKEIRGQELKHTLV